MAAEVVDLLALVLRGDQSKSIAITQPQNGYSPPPVQYASPPPQYNQPPQNNVSALESEISAYINHKIVEGYKLESQYAHGFILSRRWIANLTISLTMAFSL